MSAGVARHRFAVAGCPKSIPFQWCRETDCCGVKVDELPPVRVKERPQFAQSHRHFQGVLNDFGISAGSGRKQVSVSGSTKFHAGLQ